MKKGRWGILGTADIAHRQLIPSLQSSESAELVAVASRDASRAQSFAKEHHISRSYGSYEQLLDDETIDIVYIPLPNHLHVAWIKQAVAAGKHVLCEKPLALTIEDVEQLIALRDATGYLIGEAYAPLHQSRLVSLRHLFETEQFGKLESLHSTFMMHLTDMGNIRNAFDIAHGGGALWDIGVYPITVGRWLFDEEPVEVFCTMDVHQEAQVDHLTTGVLRFPSGGQMTFTCGMRYPFHTALSCYTQTHRFSVPNPFFSNEQYQMIFEVFDDKNPEHTKTYSFTPEDQYRIQCDHFTEAALEGAPFVGSLERTLGNTRTLLALIRSAASGRSERV